MIASLGEILHYTIDHTNGDATLAQELQHAQNYLSFYQRRFPRLFVYSVSCEEALLDHRVIKYLLQPIVENSVKHGFRSRRGGGKITIEARREGNDLVCEVSDNGCGITSERLEEIRRNMKLAMRSPSVGIANTDARIKSGTDCPTESSWKAGRAAVPPCASASRIGSRRPPDRKARKRMYKGCFADDEPIVCQVMANIVDWKRLSYRIAGTASDGREWTGSSVCGASGKRIKRSTSSC